METGFKKISFSLVVIFCASCVAFADWDPGDSYKMHFPQLPNPQGWDVRANEPELADDFQCIESGPITDIHIWYSVFGDEQTALLQGGVVRIYDDIPAGTGGTLYSRPGNMLWQWVFGMNDMVTRIYGDGLQGWYDPREEYFVPANHHNIWQLNLTNIPEPFIQEEGKIYWLAVQLNTTFTMGWKTSLNYWNDTAVWRNAIGAPWQMLIDPMNGEPLSFAFVITNDGVVHNNYDFGDAPDQPYPTLLANTGAQHKINPNMFLGAAIDGEADGQPTAAADGDDLTGLPDDEDGVIFSTPLIAGQNATVNITASMPGFLDAWIDFNNDGVWSMALPEQIATSLPLVAGINTLTFTVPATATIGQTYARFRYSSAGGLLPSGLAVDGEVEDYTVVIEEEIIPDPNVKYVQWPDTTPTGIDIRVDDGDGVTRHIADDFPCTVTGPITDVHFWGSWKNDKKSQINGFVVRFYSDDPVGIGGSKPNNEYSMPDQLLWTRTFLPGQFTETLYYTLRPDTFEWWWDPYPPFQILLQNGDQNIWQYDIYIDPCDAFIQQGTLNNPKVYWLEIEAWTPYQEPNNQFGWKTSNTHWNDDAVFANGSNYPWISGWSELRYPPPHPNCPNSLDMAFMITTGGVHEDYKWEQKPDLSETGIDVKATQPFILADDFRCNQQGLITEIVVWASWKNDLLPPGGANDVAFTLSLHSDIPDPDPLNPLDYSMPGNTLWIKNFAPKTYDVKIERADIQEGWWVPNDPLSYIFPGDTICWKYTFQIPPNEAFCQEGTPELPVIYWLDVQAQPIDPMGEVEFGWKTSLQHWNDDAVWGMGMEPYAGPWNELIYPPQHELQGQSIDLAFAISGGGECPKADLGDAPDSTNTMGLAMTAYSGLVSANFPTVFSAGSPPYGPIHKNPLTAFYLGNSVSLENEADTGIDQDTLNNIDPLLDTPNLDGFDDGVAVPIKMPRCRLVKFNYTVTVADATKPIFANVWCDFNRDGDWDDTPMCSSTKPAPEWAVADQSLTFATPGTYVVSTPPFRVYDDTNTIDIAEIWMRITLSETPAMQSGAGGSGPMTGYLYGETEDYFFTPDLSCSDCADFDLSGVIDWFDMKEMTDNWLWTGSTGVMDADLDCDGDIEFVDFAILAEQWFLSCP